MLIFPVGQLVVHGPLTVTVELSSDAPIAVSGFAGGLISK